MKFHVTRRVIAATLLSLFAGTAFGGMVVQFEHRSNREAGIVRSHAWIEPDRLRMQIGRRVMIYRPEKALIWILDDENKQYMELTEAQLKEVSRGMAKMMEQMQEQLKNMPPEQRAMMEKMMAGKVPAAGQKEVSPIEYRKTGQKQTINGFDCTSYDGIRDGRREMELWITDWSNIDAKASDFKVLEELAALFKGMTGPMAKTFDIGLAQKYEGEDAVPGVPIRMVVTLDDGESFNEIKKISREEIPPGQFDVPDGYVKAEMMGR
jgi:hypothetical protein